MSFRPFATAALAALLVAPVVTAQGKVYGGPDPDRKASTMFVFGPNFSAMAGASINYSSPDWKEDYNGQLDKLKGKNIRLGKNWWTSLDTITALEIGGTKIEPGSYYLGMHCDKDGKFSLLILDATKALKAGMLPFAADAWKADFTAPLNLGKDALKDTVAKMEIELKADENDPTKGTFSVRWGKHELSAPVKIALAGAKK